MALAGVMAGLLGPAGAHAEYLGGCTYSWGAPCYIVYGYENYLITQDPDHAYRAWGGGATNNGYKPPTYDGRERDVCGTIMSHEGTLGPFGWSCAWGQVVETYPTTLGYSAIGTGQVYYGISLYQMVDYSEYGPCGQYGSEC